VSDARKAALAYLALFALLLLPLPRRGALPGNCDTWLNGLALPNYMLNRVAAGLTGEVVGAPLYPAPGILGFGESAFGTSAIFIVYKVITRDDVLAYYAFAVTLLALDALGVFLLARHYVRTPLAAAFAGLAFAASNYILGNIDSPHTSFFFVAFLCLHHLKRYLASGDRRSLMWAAVLGAAQAYFSAYVFLFQTLAGLALLAAHRFRAGGALRPDAGGLARAAAVFAALGGPFFAFYAASHARADFTNPWDPVFLAEVHSLEPSDLLRTLENNLLYPLDRRIVAADVGAHTKKMVEAGVVTLASLTGDDATTVFGKVSTPDDVKYFVYTRRCAFLGLVLYGLAGLGLAAAAPRARWELAVLYVSSLLIALGPLIFIGGFMVPNLTYPAYRWLDATGVLRVPCRAFSFSVVAVVIAAAVGLERLAAVPALQAPRRRRAAFAVATVAVLLENVPWPLKSFAGTELARPEPLVLDYFAGRRGHVVLDLPSRPGGALFRDSQDLFEWNRELIYMNRQTYHRQNVVNGVHGYFPRTRLQVQKMIDALPAPEAFSRLRALGVDHLVYHRALELPWERGLYRKLAAAPELVTLASTPEVTIFGWAPAAAGSAR
jgi:hypothetical protein